MVFAEDYKLITREADPIAVVILNWRLGASPIVACRQAPGN